MAHFGGFNFSTFSGINLKNTAYLRLQINAQAGTLSVNESYGDSSRAWNFPNKSGTFPIMGTFAVQLPAIAANTHIFNTSVTVSGVRTEDGLIVQVNKGASAGYAVTGSGVSARILTFAEAQNGSVLLTFANVSAAATAYVELIASYVAVR